MSWFFGFISKNDNDYPKFLKNSQNIHRTPLFSKQNQNAYIACGGFEKTCLWDVNKKENSGWIVCGSGIIKRNNQFDFAEKNDWNGILSHNKLKELNGHFVILEWTNNEISIRNDQFGLRDCFFYEDEKSIAFSTRLDWLTKFSNNPRIDFKSFSTRYNFIDSLSEKSIIKGIKRLYSNGTAIIGKRHLSIKNKPWSPERIPNANSYEIAKLIEDLTTFPLENRQSLILALSGGMDSRTLFSPLLSANSSNWKAVTFGEVGLSDIKIAKQITSAFNIPHQVYTQKLPSETELVNTMEEFLGLTNAAMPAYHSYELDYYKFLDKNNVFIDGGEGGYIRGIAGNKLLFYGKKAIKEKNPHKLFTVFQTNTSQISKTTHQKIS